MKQEPKDRLGTVAEDREGGSKDDQESLKSNEFFKGVDWKGLEEVFFFGIHTKRWMLQCRLLTIGWKFPGERMLRAPDGAKKHTHKYFNTCPIGNCPMQQFVRERYLPRLSLIHI